VNKLVWLDADGFIDHDWMAVIVHAPTGVFYRQQYGGAACRHGTVEGYLVPVFSACAFAKLSELFEGTLRGAGTWNWSWPGDLLLALRESIGMVKMPTSTWADFPDEAEPLRVDDTRLAEIDEAWVPVISPDGPGVLTWPNSD
jgi:hypothetical protein